MVALRSRKFQSGTSLSASTATVAAVKAPGAPEISEREAFLALAALCTGLFITMMDQTLVAVALPQIREDLDASINQAVWVSAVYLLAFAVPLLIAGRLGDRFGQRNVYLVGIGLFAVGAVACSLAPNIETLIALRAVQGLGASLANPQPLSVINRIFPRSRRGAAMGIWSAVAGSAGLFGPVAGGLLVGTVGWRWTFFLYLPLGLVCIALVAMWVPKLPSVAGRIDFLSAAVSFVAVLAVVFSVQQGPDLGWPLWLWVLLVCGLVAFALFMRLQETAQRRGTDALVPLELFAYRNFSLGIFSVAMLGFTVYAVNLPIMLYLQEGAGMSAQSAGVLMVPMAAVSMLVAPFIGRVADRVAPGRVSMLGFSSLITSMVLFALFMMVEVPAAWMLIPLVLLGAANGLSWSPNSTISMRDLPPQLVGAASGVYNTSRQVGAVLGAASLGAVMQIAGRLTDFNIAMASAMLFPVLFLVFGLIAVANFRTDIRVTETDNPARN